MLRAIIKSFFYFRRRSPSASYTLKTYLPSKIAPSLFWLLVHLKVVLKMIRHIAQLENTHRLQLTFPCFKLLTHVSPSNAVQVWQHNFKEALRQWPWFLDSQYFFFKEIWPDPFNLPYVVKQYRLRDVRITKAVWRKRANQSHKIRLKEMRPRKNEQTVSIPSHGHVALCSQQCGKTLSVDSQQCPSAEWESQ